jgi:hypothetical protein
LSKDIQFVTDADGNRTGAVIPIEEYEEWFASHEEVGKEDSLNLQLSVEPVEREELTAVLQSALSAAFDLHGGRQA